MACFEINLVKKHDGDLSKAIKIITTTMSGVREQAKATEDEIHSTMERLISLLRDREIVLIMKEEILLLLIIPTIAFRYLIEMASSCSSLGRMEMEMDNSHIPTE